MERAKQHRLHTETCRKKKILRPWPYFIRQSGHPSSCRSAFLAGEKVGKLAEKLKSRSKGAKTFQTRRWKYSLDDIRTIATAVNCSFSTSLSDENQQLPKSLFWTCSPAMRAETSFALVRIVVVAGELGATGSFGDSYRQVARCHRIVLPQKKASCFSIELVTRLRTIVGEIWEEISQAFCLQLREEEINPLTRLHNRSITNPSLSLSPFLNMISFFRRLFIVATPATVHSTLGLDTWPTSQKPQQRGWKPRDYDSTTPMQLFSQDDAA